MNEVSEMQRKFISENIGIIDDYEISKMYLEYSRRRIAKILELHINMRLINEKKDFEFNLKAITKKHIDIYGTIEKARLAQNFKYTGVNGIELSNGNVSFKLSGSLGEIFRMIRYINTGKIDRNLAEGNRIADELGWSLDISSFPRTWIEGIGCELSKIKSRRVYVIHKITQTALDSLRELGELAKIAARQ